MNLQLQIYVTGCMDTNATNYNLEQQCRIIMSMVRQLCTYASCADIPTEMVAYGKMVHHAECGKDGGTVLRLDKFVALVEVVFEVNLPDGVNGTPHVNGTYNGWCGSCYNHMSDEDGDGIWSHVQYFSAGEYHDYKFHGWEAQEDLTGLDCAAEAIDGCR